MAIISVAQMAIRVPLTYVVDPVPFASFGVFWGGVAAAIYLLVIGILADTGIGVWWLIRKALRR